jgi:hypothetical protein
MSFDPLWRLARSKEQRDRDISFGHARRAERGEDVAKKFTRYADWIRHSNSAAIYREAFALSDQMDDSIRGAVVEAIYGKANAEWEKIKQLSPQGLPHE